MNTSSVTAGIFKQNIHQQKKDKHLRLQYAEEADQDYQFNIFWDELTTTSGLEWSIDGSLIVRKAIIRNDKYLARCLGKGEGTVVATEEVDKDLQKQQIIGIIPTNKITIWKKTIAV